MKLRNMLLAATVLALPVAASAQPVNGIYVGGSVGFNYLSSVSTNAGSGGNYKGDGGFVGIGSVGYGLGNGLRLEIEGDYRNNPMRRSGAANGNLFQVYGVMGNAIYDFDTGTGWIYPFLGIGAGYQETSLSRPAPTATKGGFAVNGIAGAAFPIAQVPGLSVTAQYRFMGVLTNENYQFAGGITRTGNQYNHAALIGMRYAFGAPALMTQTQTTPGARVEAPRSYLVFFDWDKSDLSARAKQIIGEAAQASTKNAVTRIEVAGYADTSGTHVYNQGLSQRRANNVAAELVRDGVPKAAIAISAFGDTKLLVPTGPGVREPQNRRVEIVLK